MKTQKNKIIAWVLFGIISFCSIIYFGNQKEGYHVDEIYSYGLSNSEYLPFMHFGEHDYDVKDWMMEYGAGESFTELLFNLIKDVRILKEADFDLYQTEIYHSYLKAQENSADTYTTTWVSGEAYQHYLAVSEENTFNYASVYYNQRGDVHPPLFYILLHTICSVFQGSFSKWFGIGLNIVILLLAVCALYQMCDKHLGGTKTAVYAVSMYIFSVGFISTAMFIRMYALLTFIMILCTYVHLEIQAAEYQFSKKKILALFLTVLCGYYTQYYFVLYAIAIAIVMLAIMLGKQKFKSAVTYVLTLVAAAVIGICIWPFSIKHVFSGYRGRESLQILQTGRFYWYKADYMIHHISDNVFGGHLSYAIILLICALGIIIFYKKKKAPYAKFALLFVPTLVYTLIVGQISPFLTDRYVMCTYPFWCVLLVSVSLFAVNCFVSKIQTVYPDKKRISVLGQIICFCIIAFFIFFNNYIKNTPGYLNIGGQESYVVNENTDCIFIIPDGSYNESSEEIPILAQCRKVGVVYESNLDVLKEEYVYQNGDYLLIEIVNSLDENSVLEKVKKTFHVEYLQELDREYAGCAVRILLGT